MDGEDSRDKILELTEALENGDISLIHGLLGTSTQAESSGIIERLEAACRYFREAEPNLLDSLALLHGTDKSSAYHNYVRHYERFLRPLRGKARRVLEIGVKGGASLKMWADYFPQAVIYGVDNDPESFRSDQGRIKTFLGDQADPEFLKQVLSETGSPFDVIIDDGGHTMQQQKVSLVNLFPHVKPGGLYIIEDTHTSYYDYMGGGLNNPLSMIENIKRLIDDLHFSGQADLGDPIKVMELNPQADFSLFQRTLESIWIAKSVIVLTRHDRGQAPAI